MKSPQANESAVGNFGYWDIILCPFCFQRNATCHENMLGKSAKQIFDMMRDDYIGPVRHVASPHTISGGRASDVVDPYRDSAERRYNGGGHE